MVRIGCVLIIRTEEKLQRVPVSSLFRNLKGRKI